VANLLYELPTRVGVGALLREASRSSPVAGRPPAKARAESFLVGHHDALPNRVGSAGIRLRRGGRGY